MFLTLLFVLEVTVTTVDNIILDETDPCPTQCQCEGSTVTCKHMISDYVPSRFSEVIPDHVYRAELMPGRLCNVTWTGVKALSIISVQHVYEYGDAYFLPDDVFNCSNYLDVLRIRISPLQKLTVRSFIGLTNVSELDLSGCERLLTNDLAVSLKFNTTLPNLSKLVLVRYG